MKILLIVTGIGNKGYGLADVIDSGLYDIAKKHYDLISEIDYQPILDKYAMCFKTLGDPLRFMLSSKSHKVVKFVKEELSKFEGAEVDLLTHSLGGWICEEIPFKIKNWYSIASATGWFLPFGQMMIQTRIGTPKMVFDKRYWFYSGKDIVSSRPPAGNTKFNTNTTFIETGLPHDLKVNLKHNIFIDTFMKDKL